jgi:hypothetical protein
MRLMKGFVRNTTRQDVFLDAAPFAGNCFGVLCTYVEFRPPLRGQQAGPKDSLAKGYGSFLSERRMSKLLGAHHASRRPSMPVVLVNSGLHAVPPAATGRSMIFPLDLAGFTVNHF